MDLFSSPETWPGASTDECACFERPLPDTRDTMEAPDISMQAQMGYDYALLMLSPMSQPE